MISFIAENAGTIIISAVLILIVAGIIRKIAGDKKAGRNSCGCACSSCALRDKCHSAR